MCTPKDFTVDTCFIGNWLIVTVGFAVEFNSLCLEPIRRNSVFVIFKVSLLAASHTRILSKSRLILTSQINPVANHAMWMGEQILSVTGALRTSVILLVRIFLNAQQIDTFILLDGVVNLLSCQIEIHDQISFSFFLLVSL